MRKERNLSCAAVIQERLIVGILPNTNDMGRNIYYFPGGDEKQVSIIIMDIYSDQDFI